MAHLLALLGGSVGAHDAPAPSEPADEHKTWKAQLQAKRKCAQTEYAEAEHTVKRMRANLRQLRLEKQMARRRQPRGKLAGAALKERVKFMVASRILKRQRAKAAAAEQDKMAAQRAWNSTQLRTQGSASVW